MDMSSFQLNPNPANFRTLLYVCTCNYTYRNYMYVEHMFLHVGLHIGRAAYCVLIIIRFGARRRNHPICFFCPEKRTRYPSILVQLYTYMSIVLFRQTRTYRDTRHDSFLQTADANASHYIKVVLPYSPSPFFFPPWHISCPL